MKIGYFVITVLLIVMKTNICLQAKIDHSLYISPNPKINFFEMNSKTKMMSSMTSSSRVGLKYKCRIIVHKLVDSLDDKPVEFDAQVEFGKKELKVYMDGKLKKEISYLEYYKFI